MCCKGQLLMIRCESNVTWPHLVCLFTSENRVKCAMHAYLHIVANMTTFIIPIPNPDPIVQTESFFELCYICKLRVVCLRGNCPFLSWTLPRCTPCQPWSERWPETVRRSHCGYCQQVMGSPFPHSRSTLPSCGGACRTHPWWRRSSPARTSSWPMVSSLLSVTNTCNLYSMDQWNGISDPFSDPFS